MNIRELKDQILNSIDLYSVEELKVVVAKLLDFLLDSDEEKAKILADNENCSAENEKLKHEISELQNEITKLTETKENNLLYIEQAKKEADGIIKEAKSKEQSIINTAREKSDEIISEGINKLEEIIESIKKHDEAAKVYRNHIISIFRKTIYRFSDTNFYIIRNDNKDFRNLIQFFETDKEIQKYSDEIMAKLDKDPKYQKLIEKFDNNSEQDINEILKEVAITVDEKVLEDIDLPEETKLEDIFDEDNNAEPKKQNTAKFLDIINQYNKK